LEIPLLGLFLIIAAIKFIRSCLKKEFITAGSLFLHDDSILIKTPDVTGIPINLSDLESVNINYNGYLGESFPFSLYSFRNFQSKDGNKNYIQLVRKTHTVEFEFFLANNAQRINLIRQLRIYRKKGISVSMIDGQGNDMLNNPNSCQSSCKFDPEMAPLAMAVKWEIINKK